MRPAGPWLDVEPANDGDLPEVGQYLQHGISPHLAMGGGVIQTPERVYFVWIITNEIR